MLSPEAPYPLHGGGAYRTASLLHYFARLAPVDLIFISNTGEPALLPPGLVRSQSVIPLPRHNRAPLARYMRNAWRAARGVPPLIDRLSGLGAAIERSIRGRNYDIGVIEHFWCAPYATQMFPACSRTILNLHNVESILHERCASHESALAALGHARFARACRKLESKFLPLFSLVLAASAHDAEFVVKIAPGARAAVYRNALPEVKIPDIQIENKVVFSGNFEYHPNIDAVRFLVQEIWPAIARANPGVRLRLVGRGVRSIERLIRQPGVEATGAIEDAFREIASAVVVVAPLRAGSGTRIKILEAWAAARPVVATTIAAEGLSAESGQNCIIADDAREFAGCVNRLIQDAQERRRIGLRGRGTFEHEYTWNAVWETLDRRMEAALS